jgi:NAD(P)-dependent dehydrogenase (short-subunit alcohol dehydrogenase family)
MSQPNVAAVIGVGPGLGASVARRFAREGFAVALLARRAAVLEPVERAIRDAGGKALSVPADATDAASMGAAFARVAEVLGAPSVLVYNAGVFQMASVLDTTPAQVEQSFRANCLGALIAAQQVLPAMLKRGRGTILFTGATASLRGSARFASFAIGKFGLRALAQSLAREVGPQGIHVAHVIVDGQIDTPSMRAMAAGRDPATMLAPDAIAETYWALHAQDPTAWTHEIDVRPATEKF